ncbi:hypothetical protein ACFODT_10975 [Vibrio zhugei]|uniref:Uncharacterized protein n=1 Tax=Vibrio zhugei TaxID=2479546 RepID=A0ABV7C8K4_9VIBR|nr:hypothetical protein [Vibrio zhugei]
MNYKYLEALSRAIADISIFQEFQEYFKKQEARQCLMEERGVLVLIKIWLFFSFLMDVLGDFRHEINFLSSIY